MNSLKIQRLLFIVLVLFPLFSKAQPSAQSFSHSLGVSHHSYINVKMIGLMYSPRYNFLPLGRERTFSVGTHLSVGYAWDTEIPGASSFAYDVPLLLEFNFGHGSEPNTRKKVGGFIGAGYGINGIHASEKFGKIYKAEGLTFGGGIRFKIQNKYPLGIRLSYLINNKHHQYTILGLGVFYTFDELKFY